MQFAAALPLWKNTCMYPQSHEEGFAVIDAEGFRPNVGIILTNRRGQLFWGRRIGQSGWQFPQGGIKRNEQPVDALYRELEEEVGLCPHQVEVLGFTQGWLRYRLPPYLIRRHQRPLCIGQKQIWFMLRILAADSDVRLDACQQPEFDHWRWVEYWHPLREVVFFKRSVYRRALGELAPLVFPDGVPALPPRMERRSPRRRQSRPMK